LSKICLVRPLLSPTDFNGYPLNLLILASSLRDFAHDVIICDYDYLKEIDSTWSNGGFAKRAVEDILSCNPNFVGITAMCSNYVLALDLAEEIKALSPKTHITLGGPHVSLCPCETLDHYWYIDTAVIGEGEITYPELIKSVELNEDLSAVRGIAFRKNGKAIRTAPRPLLSDLNESPRPAYDLVDVPSYVTKAKSSYLEVYVGSGCPFRCTFCSTSIVWERKYRTMSARRIVAEMKHLNEQYSATTFNLIHDNLTSDKKFIREIATLITESGLNIRWGFSSRIDTLDYETARVAAEAGCDYIFFGVESGSAKIQTSMKKRLKLRKIYETLDHCVRCGIAPATSFILGFPDEQLEDIASTIRLAFECKMLGARRSFINLLSPYTGTPVMQENVGKLVFCMESMNSTMKSFLEEKHFEVIRSDPFIFANYYSLEYSNSLLTARDYSDLVDFYTICLFKYPCLISFLINDCEIDPLLLFRNFEDRISRLSATERNNLALEISVEELRPYATLDNAYSLSSAFCFDQAIRVADSMNGIGVIYSGNIRIDGEGAIARLRRESGSQHYLFHSHGKDMIGSELSAEHSHLYEIQGLAAVRSEVLGEHIRKDCWAANAKSHSDRGLKTSALSLEV